MARPKKALAPTHLAVIETLAGLGLTQAEIVECLPISERTLRARIADPDDGVSAAYARGRAVAKEEHSARHRDIALGKIPKVPVAEQRKALEFRLKTQFGFEEKQQIEHTGAGGPLTVRFVGPSSDG